MLTGRAPCPGSGPSMNSRKGEFYFFSPRCSSLLRKLGRTRVSTNWNGLPDCRTSGSPLTSARKSAGVGFSGMRIRSAVAPLTRNVRL
jgi:hypothetical protein